jgi:flavodoxin
MKDILVIYFSRSGYTRRIAEELALRLGADCEAIRERTSRRGILGYWRSAREALRGATVEISPLAADPRDYRLVVLGSPVWAGNICSPMRACIYQQRRAFAQLALFCTQGGSGAPKVLRKMAALCNQAPVATAFFNDSGIDRGKHGDQLEAFTAALMPPRS